MKIKIMQDGKQKEFTSGEVSGSAFRKFLVARDIIIEADKTGEFTVEMFDKMVDFIVTAFDKKFSADELLDLSLIHI